jgi:integrase
LRDYRSNLEAHLLPAFGNQALESITSASIEAWRASLTGLSPRTKNKLLVVMHGVFRRAQHIWGLPSNPVATVEKYRQNSSGNIDVFSPEEVLALVRAAASEQDAAIYLVAAFTGLRRGELLALRWRDVDFEGSIIRVRSSYAAGQLTTPKSGKVRSVPMAPDVAEALARLGQRRDWVGDDELVFPGEAGSYLDGSALRRRCGTALARAGLRPLRFHDLRHTFGTRMIAKADIRRVQEWMGQRRRPDDDALLHYAPRDGDAALVAEAFAVEHPPGVEEPAWCRVSASSSELRSRCSGTSATIRSHWRRRDRRPQPPPALRGWHRRRRPLRRHRVDRGVRTAARPS